MERKSVKNNWEKFWGERETEEMYADSERLVHNLVKVIDVKDMKVLEVGAGTGRDSMTLAALGARLFLIDYARESINKIKGLPESNKLRPVLGDALQMPFSDETFDVVFHQGLMEHFKDYMPLVRENSRVLKKNGLIVIDVPQKFHIYTVFKHILIFLGKWFAGWETEFSIKELVTIVEKNGFEVVHVYGEWLYPSLFYRIVREALKKIGIKLPMYPGTIKPIHKIRVKTRKFLMTKKFSFYTFLNIGVIAKKVTVK